MKEFATKIKVSFLSSLKRQESPQALIRWWGLISYIFFYFVVNKIIMASDNKFLDLLLSWIAVIYFSWHAIVLKLCAPKKPKLSKEEKAKLRIEKIKNAPKQIMRKILLQEPISKWNPIFMTILVDMLFITHFLGYILR